MHRLLFSILAFSFFSFPGLAQESAPNPEKFEVPDLNPLLDRAVSALSDEEAKNLAIIRKKLEANSDKINAQLKESYAYLDKQSREVLQKVENDQFPEEYKKEPVDDSMPLDKRFELLRGRIRDRYNGLAKTYKTNDDQMTELMEQKPTNAKVKEAVLGEMERIKAEQAKLEADGKKLKDLMDLVKSTEDSAVIMQKNVLQQTQNAFLDSKDSKEKPEGDLNTKAILTGKVLEALVTEAKTRQWNDAFSDFASKLKDTKTRIIGLEQALDNALVGVYVQTKLQRLINSDVFCKAAERCKLAPADRSVQSISPLFHDKNGRFHRDPSGTGSDEKTHGAGGKE